MWSNCKVVRCVEDTRKSKAFFFSLACHTVKCSKTQKQMLAKVISCGHKMKTKKKGGTAEVFLFSFSLWCQAFIIISSMSCKHQMPQTSATSTVSGRPPSAPWDICIYFLSPGFSIHLLEMTRQLPSGTDCCFTDGFRLIILFVVTYILIGWSNLCSDFKR